MLLARNVYTPELPETHKAEWDARLRCYGDTKSLTIGRVSGGKTFIFCDVKSQKKISVSQTPTMSARPNSTNPIVKLF